MQSDSASDLFMRFTNANYTMMLRGRYNQPTGYKTMCPGTTVLVNLILPADANRVYC